MAKPSISIKKPGADKSRFDEALEFAIQDQPAAVEQPEPVVEAAVPVKEKTVVAPEEENPDDAVELDNFMNTKSLKYDAELFVLNSETFKFKSQFYVQCIKDGLTKYQITTPDLINEIAKSNEPKKGKKPTDEEQVKDNFNNHVGLKREARILVLNNKRMFRSKKDFYIQCIKDGLVKYKGQ